jgi:hypothetical protein
MDRNEKKERFYNNSLDEKLRELLKVLEPGNEVEWSSWSPSRRMAMVVARLTEEYFILTGTNIAESIGELGLALVGVMENTTASTNSTAASDEALALSDA